MNNVAVPSSPADQQPLRPRRRMRDDPTRCANYSCRYKDMNFCNRVPFGQRLVCDQRTPFLVLQEVFTDPVPAPQRKKGSTP